MRFLLRYPLVRLLIPLVVGIIIGRYVTLSPVVAILVATVAITLLVVQWLTDRHQYISRSDRLFRLGVFLFLMVMGWGLCWWQQERIKPDFIGKKGVYHVLLTDAIRSNGRTVSCSVEVLSRADSTVAIKRGCKAQLYLHNDSLARQLTAGDELALLVCFDAPRGKVNPAGFDYASYLLTQGIAATAYADSVHWQKVNHHAPRSFVALMHHNRQRLLDVYRRYRLDGDEFGVLAAMTLGYRDELSEAVKSSYRNSGAMHVLAVSGLHVGIIFLILQLLLYPLRYVRHGRWLLYVVQMAGLWAYAVLVGMPASALRAALMLTLWATARVIGRESHPINNIAAAAFLLLLFRPLMLFDVGFQLSFAAASSIVLFYPLLSRPLRAVWQPARWVLGLVIVSVAAQLGVMPLTTYYFHQASVYFAVSSLIVIPLAHVLLFGALLLFVTSGVPAVATCVARVMNGVLNGMNSCIAAIDHWPHAVVPVWVDGWQVALMLAFCAALAWAVMERDYRRYLLPALLLVALSIGTAVTAVQKTHYRRVVAYADRQTDVVQLASGPYQLVMTNDTIAASDVIHNASLHYGLAAPVFAPMDTLQLHVTQFEGASYVLLSGLQLSRRVLATPVAVDYLIVGRVGRARPKDIMQSFQPGHVILLSSLARWKADSLRTMCERGHIMCHDTRVQGAYVQEEKQRQ